VGHRPSRKVGQVLDTRYRLVMLFGRVVWPLARARERYRQRKSRGEILSEHVHTGPIAFIFAGIAAIVMFNLVKILSAQMVQHPTTEGAGKVLGSLVHIG